MCVLNVSFGSKVRLRTFACAAMGSASLFTLRSTLLIYSAGSGVNRVQGVLSGFSKRLFCFGTCVCDVQIQNVILVSYLVKPSKDHNGNKYTTMYFTC